MNMKTFSEVYISTSTSGVENLDEVSSDSFRVLAPVPGYDGLRDAGLGNEIIAIPNKRFAKTLKRRREI
jgi:hypothetical protein